MRSLVHASCVVGRRHAGLAAVAVLLWALSYRPRPGVFMPVCMASAVWAIVIGWLALALRFGSALDPVLAATVAGLVLLAVVDGLAVRTSAIAPLPARRRSGRGTPDTG